MNPTNIDQLGSYELGRTLGKGAAGVVYLATSPSQPGPVAVKVLRDDLAGDDSTVSRFLREKRIFSTVDHENVVKVYDLISENDRLGIVMELLEGGDLRQLIASGELTPSESVEIARQVADGLSHIHSVGVVHRDLKPANVLVSGTPGDRTVKISDFGVSKLIDEASTRTTSTIGTPLYMAPEATGTTGAAEPSDVYALGAILFEMLVGYPPFQGEGALAVILAAAQHPTPELGGVPEVLSDLVATMLDKDASERPTAAQVLDRLRSLEFELDDDIRPYGSCPIDTTVGEPTVAIDPPSNPLPAPVPLSHGNLARSASSQTQFGDLVARHGRNLAAAAVALVALGGLAIWANNGSGSSVATEATGAGQDLAAGSLNASSKNSVQIGDTPGQGSVGAYGGVSEGSSSVDGGRSFATGDGSNSTFTIPDRPAVETNKSGSSDLTSRSTPTTKDPSSPTTIRTVVTEPPVATTTERVVVTPAPPTTLEPTTPTLPPTTLPPATTLPPTTLPPTTLPPTTEPPTEPSKKIKIIGGPSVLSVTPTSASFSYTTNGVCGTGSFTYRKQGGGVVGHWTGDRGCFGPTHEGLTRWPGIVLEPGTTYVVSITVEGQPSNGVLPKGTGSSSSSITITTPNA